MQEKRQPDVHRIAGDRVRTRRKQKRFSQTLLAQIAGTSFSQVGKIERGEGGISLRNAIAIADALTTSVDYLLGRVDNPKPVREMAFDVSAKRGLILFLEESQANLRAARTALHEAIETLKAIHEKHRLVKPPVNELLADLKVAIEVLTVEINTDTCPRCGAVGNTTTRCGCSGSSAAEAQL